MIESFDLTFSPRTFDLLCPVEICFLRIITDEHDIKCSLVIPETCCPHALPVDVFILRKALCIRAVQVVENICCMFPVKKIVGTKDLPSGKKMHRGGDHVIHTIDINHIRIREIHFQYRVIT